MGSPPTDGAFAGFSNPTWVFVNAGDRVYVCDATEDQVVIFDTSGTRLATWDVSAIVGSPSETEDIVIAADDGAHIRLGDVRNHRVIYLRRGG